MEPERLLTIPEEEEPPPEPANRSQTEATAETPGEETQPGGQELGTEGQGAQKTEVHS